MWLRSATRHNDFASVMSSDRNRRSQLGKLSADEGPVLQDAQHSAKHKRMMPAGMRIATLAAAEAEFCFGSLSAGLSSTLDMSEPGATNVLQTESSRTCSACHITLQAYDSMSTLGWEQFELVGTPNPFIFKEFPCCRHPLATASSTRMAVRCCINASSLRLAAYTSAVRLEVAGASPHDVYRLRARTRR